MMPARRLRPLLLLPLAFLLEGFQVQTSTEPVPYQAPGERAAQDKLPQSKNPLWGQLAHCAVHFNNKTALYGISISPEVKAMDGQTVTANGFVLPLDGSDKTRHFLLTKRTPVCMFCPPGEPNEVIEVTSKHPVDWTDDLVTLRGRFVLVNNGEKAIFFALRDAEKVP
ncbi:MAG: DUF3299 domain-containing protein [Magnetospirillum sp.]|nr:DUF3299 domain-containing protein [Magnetospirillum sp.]